MTIALVVPLAETTALQPSPHRPYPGNESALRQLILQKLDGLSSTLDDMRWEFNRGLQLYGANGGRKTYNATACPGEELDPPCVWRQTADNMSGYLEEVPDSMLPITKAQIMTASVEELEPWLQIYAVQDTEQTSVEQRRRCLASIFGCRSMYIGAEV